MLTPCLLELVIEDLIAVHDVAVVIYGRKKLAETVGIEEDGKDVVSAVLLHRSYPDPVFLKLLVLFCLGGFHPFLPDGYADLKLGDLIGDKADLFLNKSDRLLGSRVTLFKGYLLFYNESLLLFELLYLVSSTADIASGFFLLLVEFGKLLLEILFRRVLLCACFRRNNHCKQ